MMDFELQPPVGSDRFYVVSRLTRGLARTTAFEGMQADMALRAAYALANALWKRSTVTMVSVPGRAYGGFLVADRDQQGHILHWIELDTLVRRQGIAKAIVARMAETPLRVTSRSPEFRELVRKHIGKARVVYSPWPLFCYARANELDLADRRGYHRQTFRLVKELAYEHANRIRQSDDGS